MDTPCPQCAGAIRVRGEDADCPHCGLHVRFVDVPERPCESCGKAVARRAKVVRCGHCGHLQAADPGRRLRFVAVCPRCRRDVNVDRDSAMATCPSCGTAMSLRDTV